MVILKIAMFIKVYYTVIQCVHGVVNCNHCVGFLICSFGLLCSKNSELMGLSRFSFNQ